MFEKNTDVAWEKIGANNPYYGVLTFEEYRHSNISEETREIFFQSGLTHIESILQKIRSNIDKEFTINRALDFGCGVGRLVIPLSKIAQEVTGVDVSESMLEEAKKNCEKYSIKNVKFIKSDDDLSRLSGKYNLIHSFIVFQHIPTKRGRILFKNILEHLEEGGVCILHFTYASNLKRKKLVSLIKKYIPLGNNFINLAKRRNFFEPPMQMNAYDINDLLAVIQNFGIKNCFIDFTSHMNELGVIIYFQKS